MSAVCSSSSATAHLPVKKKRAYLKKCMSCMNNLNPSEGSFLIVTWCLSLQLIHFFFFETCDEMLCRSISFIFKKIYIASFDLSTYKWMDSGV